MRTRRPRPRSRDDRDASQVSDDSSKRGAATERKRARQDKESTAAPTASERALSAAVAATKALGCSGHARADDKHSDHVAPDDAQKLFDEFLEQQDQDDHEQRRGPKRDFTPSGRLKQDAALKYKGKALKFDEPPDAAAPQFSKDGRWRLYVFKGDTRLGDPYILHQGSCFLAGRDRAVVDIPLDHPTCSSQHCVFQYRRVATTDGATSVRLFIMDLASTNGTYLNGNRLRPHVYVELKSKDVLKFALSTREYVVVKEPPP